MDAVVREEFEPRSNMFPHADGEVLNDEVIIIHSPGSIGEPEVFEPYARVNYGGSSPLDDVTLDLASATSGAAHRVMCMGHIVVHRACWSRWRLVLSPLS